MTRVSLEEKTVAFNGLTWSYRCAGEGSPLVWLHGLWGEPGWESHHQRLAERYRVYAPVLPGYHGSNFPEWMSDMEDVAMLVVEFLDALELDHPLLVGHSLGGWAAAELALFRPSRLRSLVLIDPLGLALDWTRLPNIFYIDPAMLTRLFFANPDTDAARRYLPPPADWDERLITNRAACARLAFEPYLHGRKLRERLRFAQVPALIMWGADDRLLDAGHAAQWKALMPQAEVSIVEQAGHFPHIEQPQLCLPRLLAFLRRTETGGGDNESL